MLHGASLVRVTMCTIRTPDSRRCVCLVALDTFLVPWHFREVMTARELLRILRSHGCLEIRQKGSHIRVRCGKCSTTVPNHKGEDVGTGLLAKIERDLEPCLGKGWLKS